MAEPTERPAAPQDSEDGDSAEGAGWDQARHSVQRATETTEVSPERLRRWRRARFLTGVCAALQFAPVLLVFSDYIHSGVLEGVIALSVLTAGLCLLPSFSLNLVNLAYPLVTPLILWAGLHLAGQSFGLYEAIAELTAGLFFDRHAWEYWPFRIAGIAGVVLIIGKGFMMWGRSKADKDAVRYWWRRPKGDAVEAPWS